MEKVKVKIKIAGNEFTVLSQDDENYTYLIAEEVDKKIEEICTSNPQVSVTAAAMLAAINFCDSTHKFEKDTADLRQQIKDYLEEASKNKTELDELRKENQRLKKDIKTYRQRLGEESTLKNDTYAPVSTAVKAVKKSVLISDAKEAEDEEDTGFFDIKSE